MANFLEYLTSNESVFYPFREGALGLVSDIDDIAHGATPRGPKDFISDAVIVTPETYYSVVYLESIARSGTTFTFTLTNDAGGSVAQFDVSTPVGSHQVIQVLDYASRKVNVRILTGPGFDAFLLGITDFTSDTFDTDLPFETAAVEFRPSRLDTLRVPDGVGGELDLEGAITLQEGFNIQLDTQGDTGQDQTDISLNAIAGAGAGFFSNCDDPEAVTPVDFLAKLSETNADDDGNMDLVGADCHRIQADPSNNRLFLYNDCVPCCECEDYANLVETLRLQMDRLANVKLQFGGAVFGLQIAVGDYNTGLFPDIRTVGAVCYLITGIEGDSGTSKRYATLTIVITSRVTHDVTITGQVELSENAEIVHEKREGKQQIQPGMPAPPNTIIQLNVVAMESGTEAHTYMLLKGEEEDITEMTATMTLDWVQYGQAKQLVVECE